MQPPPRALAVKNWAGNVTYRTTRVVRPASVEEAQELVATNAALRPRPTRSAACSMKCRN